MKRLDGRVAVVTGAGSGIGRALALRLAAEGMSLALADVEEPALAETAEAATGRGAEVLAVTTDVSDREAVATLARRAEERFGQVHLLCNNAGVGGGGLIADTPIQTWEWIVGVNLWGVVHVLRAFLPSLMAADEAHVVNTASVAGLIAAPGMAPYCATKHAVVAISETLHHEMLLLGSPVGVSVLCPGWVRTRIADSVRNWPARLGSPPVEVGGGAREAVADFVRSRIEAGLEPSEVAAMVIDAVRHERFWVITDSDYARLAVARYQRAARGEPPEMVSFA